MSSVRRCESEDRRNQEADCLRREARTAEAVVAPGFDKQRSLRSGREDNKMKRRQKLAVPAAST